MPRDQEPSETSLLSHWSNYWLAARWPSKSIQRLRLALCVVAACWFLSFLPELPVWFGVNGILNSEMSSILLDYGAWPSWQMWSPLWWTDQVFAYYAWLAIGILLCGLTAFQVGGTMTAVGLWLVAIAWTHRITWLAGVVEPALMSLLGYVVLLSTKKKANEGEEGIAWQSLGMRMLRTHVWLLLAFGVLSQLASLIWWRGDAVWWLAAAGRSNVLTVESLQNRPELANWLTHGIIWMQLIALWLLATQSARRVGIVMGWIVCLAMALVWDQVLYGLLLAIALSSYWDEPTQGAAPIKAV